MKKLFENWRGYLTEEEAGGPGQYLGTMDDIGSTLYRISKRKGPAYSSNKPADRDWYYKNSDGEVEHRIYFFKSQDEAMGVLFSGAGMITAYIGELEEDDDLDDLFITSYSPASFPNGLEFFTDPELENYSAMYASFPDGKSWKIKPQNAVIASQIVQAMEDYEPEYEDYEPEYY